MIWDARAFIDPVRWKSWVGFWRFVHFLAVAYLAFAAVGPKGIRLTTGWGVVIRAPKVRLAIRFMAGFVLIATVPWTYIAEVKWASPSLDSFFFENFAVDARYLGLFQLAHLTALIVLIWHSIGDTWRQWLVRDAFLACVPVIRKVGTQSLAVFLVSIVVARFNGWWMDAWSAALIERGPGYFEPRDVWMVGFVNITGFAVLIATAYSVAWFKRQPWRDRPQAPASATESTLTGKARPMPAE